MKAGINHKLSTYISTSFPSLVLLSFLYNIISESDPQSFGTILPCLQKLPQFLSDTHYENPSDMTNTAFQRGHNTTEPLFGWIVEHPLQHRRLQPMDDEAKRRTTHMAKHLPCRGNLSPGYRPQDTPLRRRGRRRRPPMRPRSRPAIRMSWERR